MSHSVSTASPIDTLSPFQRWCVLAAAFAGWMFAGLQISLFVLVARPAMRDLLPSASEADIGDWFAWFQCAFLLGAASGGWLFGWLGDRIGRTRSLAASILCYSLVTAVCVFVNDPFVLVALRFIACLGVGGAWPNAVSLSVEALPTMSKALLAGLMGAAANVGFVLLGVIAYYFTIGPDSWRWTLWVGASPAILGFAVLLWLPESPRWLADRKVQPDRPKAQPMREILRPPLLSRTIIGICLGAVPVIGTSANANWLIPWADQAANQRAKSDDTAAPDSTRPEADARETSLGAKPPVTDPRRKAALTQITRSGGAIIGSLLGGWIASLLGRRITYFLISLISLATSSYIFNVLDPLDPQFTLFTFLLGFVGVTYFGWLPLYLPELFPTRVRSTGTGVTFNSGRILAAASVLGAGGLMQLFDGDYARVGTFTGLIYAVGMVVVCFAPDTTKQPKED
jgi:SHS family sialic acid transporter-like MFS transporter